LRISRERQAEKRAARIAGGEEAQRQESKRRTNGYLRRQYGITLEEYEERVRAQEGRCAICGMPPIARGKTDSLVVDHCHKNGNVRSLLCGKCNTAIGLFDDDPVIAIRAANYLHDWSKVS
jgi:hypothetical protein